MKFKHLLILPLIGLLFGSNTAEAQIQPINTCNVKSMTKVGKDLFVATSEGYLVFDTENGVTEEMNAVGNTSSIIAKSKTDVWYTLNKGMTGSVNHFDGSKTTEYSVANGGLPNHTYADYSPKGLTYGQNGQVMFGAYGWFHVFDGTKWGSYTCPKSNFGRIYYKAFGVDSNGTIWVGGSDQQKNAIFGEFDPVAGEQLPVETGIVASSTMQTIAVNSIFVDGDDNVWIGTDQTGFAKYDGTKFEYFNKANNEDMPSENTIGLCKTDNGFIYYAYAKKVVAFNGEYFTPVADVFNEEFPRDEITCLYSDGTNIFIGTALTGVHVYYPETGETVQVADGTVISGINNAVADKAKTSKAIYDLGGRQVKNTQKGQLYIQNGQKFLAK